ncbi:hypothetical protein [Nocardia cyriacigeorgica]|uniref:hypothetical protein n=1 Tax=Nocardia cyriacigeorgica TaxID=135487 RepID=UPI002492B478|nr:hypothetical protein [Nocardia cyriacigeorgica]BDT89853.1 hypothetical protein FMUAM8_56170 [Nocardia cyriacigeorgica]
MTAVVPGNARRSSGPDPRGNEPSPADLHALAERQAALVRALVAGEPTPPGFDAAALHVAEAALLRKRAGILAKHSPMLAHAAGPDFEQKFAAWARGRPKVSTEDDIYGFAAHLGVQLPKTRVVDRIRGAIRRLKSRSE